MSVPSSAEQLRAIVTDLPLRRPEEVMGEAASSSLVSSTITAAVAGVTLVFGLTVVMFLFGGGPPQPRESAKAVAASADKTSSTAESAQASPAEVAAGATGTETTGSEAAAASDPAAAIDAMGISDAKDPDSDPESLENRLDKILDGLE